MAEQNTGKITQVIGAVLDIRFDQVFFQKLTMPLKSVEKMAPSWLQRQHSISVTILSDVSQWVQQTDL